jgi:cytosine/adenosine deaminase-related metal-dependent hydrolase
MPSCRARNAGGSRSDAVASDPDASINVAQAWGKDKEYGSVEPGKVADFFIVNGDPLKNISDTQNVDAVFSAGRRIDTTFHADYKNPMPRPIEDRPEP